MTVTTYEINGITINKTDNTLCWKMVHDGTNVISLSENDSIIETTSNIFVAQTESECFAEIERLDLVFLQQPKTYNSMAEHYLDNMESYSSNI